MTDTFNDSQVSSLSSSHGLLSRALEVEKRLSDEKQKTENKVLETIVAKDGIFCIQNNLETADIKQDPEFLSLVESVLGKN